MPLGMEVGLGPGHIVLDWDPAAPTFQPTLLWNGHPSQLLLSTCGIGVFLDNFPSFHHSHGSTNEKRCPPGAGLFCIWVKFDSILNCHVVVTGTCCILANVRHWVAPCRRQCPPTYMTVTSTVFTRAARHQPYISTSRLASTVTPVSARRVLDSSICCGVFLSLLLLLAGFVLQNYVLPNDMITVLNWWWLRSSFSITS